jgi:two-component system chemotaxis response regulator CheY
MELKDYKFLVVDDHFLLRQMVATTLKEFGYANCDTANDGIQGLEKIRQMKNGGSRYHVVFLDLNMPNLSGYEVLEHCRLDRELDDMAIIVISSESEEANILKVMKAGATAYITKPFRAEAILAKLKDIEVWRNKKVSAG